MGKRKERNKRSDTPPAGNSKYATKQARSSAQRVSEENHRRAIAGRRSHSPGSLGLDKDRPTE